MHVLKKSFVHVVSLEHAGILPLPETFSSMQCTNAENAWYRNIYFIYTLAI